MVNVAVCFLLVSLCFAGSAGPASSKPHLTSTTTVTVREYQSAALNRLVTTAVRRMREPEKLPQDNAAAVDAARLFYDLERPDLLAQALAYKGANVRGVAMEYAERLPLSLQYEIVVATLGDDAVFKPLDRIGEGMAAYNVFIGRYSRVLQKVLASRHLTHEVKNEFLSDPKWRQQLRAVLEQGRQAEPKREPKGDIP